MSRYRNFRSKSDLIVDFLQRRERLSTPEWLEAESQRRGTTPRAAASHDLRRARRMVRRPDFEGSAFLTTMMEVSDKSGSGPPAAVQHLATVRGCLSQLAAGRVSPTPTPSRGNGTSS